jgi:hypothetical protein
MVPPGKGQAPQTPPEKEADRPRFRTGKRFSVSAIKIQ